MTEKDTNDKTDLAKEIEELDSFLDDQDVDFPLDDDEVDEKPVFAPPPMEQKKKVRKKATSGKYMVYFIFLLFLFGAGYAGLVFAPQFIETGPKFDKVQKFVKGNSEDFIGNITNKIKSYLPSSHNDKVASVEKNNDYSSNEVIHDLPTPSDDKLLNVNELKATTIADVVEITQKASESINQNINTPTKADIQADAIMNDLQGEIREEEEHIPSLPDVVDLEPLQEDILEIEEQVQNIPDDILVDIVENNSDYTPEEVMEEVEEIVEDVIEDDFTPVQVIETKRAVPVKTPNVAVLKKTINEPKKEEDPRVKQAREAMEQKNYGLALDLYQAILKDDTSNTSALTGRQLVQAKMRMADDNVMIRPTTNRSVDVTPRMPVTSNVSAPSNVKALLQRFQVNPNNAQLAFDIGNAYKTSDKIKAIQWYRKALELDVINSSGIDRMSVYDAMADIQ